MSYEQLCICVPARNEAGRLPVLLEALAAQSIVGRIAVCLCLNNCDDGSGAVVRTIAARYGRRLDVRVDECALAPAIAHAGTARRRAMDAGMAMVQRRGTLISTDADCRPPVDWVAANLAARAAGADIVGGRLMLDDAEAAAPALIGVQARLARYWAMVRDIEDEIDPSPHDPPPRHGDHTGASLAIDAALYRKVGGVPAIPNGEDRALVAAAVTAGGKLVHPMTVWTRASPRREGRAAGGMAAAMTSLMDTISRGDEPRVAAFDHWRRRAVWRRQQRARFGISAMLASEANLPPMPRDMPLPGLTG